MSPSIYILRNNTDKIPTDCEIGDCVILPNGDVLVKTQTIWDLLPGSLISIDELKEFVGYVSSGWPDGPETARADMEGKVPAQFLSRMVQAVERLQEG
jgi:hypothetical protein